MRQTVTNIDTVDFIELRMLRLFESVGHSGSFSDAGRQFGVPRTYVSRLIGQLETQLAVRLFQRTTRKVVLTVQGAAMLQQLGPALNELRAALEKTQAKTDAVGGTVTLSVAHGFGRHYVLPALAAFRLAYPDITIEVRFSDSIDNLIDASTDLVIRQGSLPDSSIVARKLGSIPIVFAVSQALVDQPITKLTIRDISKLPSIGFRIPGTGSLYQWTLEKNEQYIRLEPLHHLTTDSIEAVADLVKRGYGIAPIPRYLVEDSIADGSVLIALEAYKAADISAYLCFESKQLMPKRLRLLADYLFEAIASALR